MDDTRKGSAATRRRRRSIGRGAPTLRDVADVAGVSTASASRALVRPDQVSEVLRLRVVAAAASLSYVTNAAARALARRAPRLVGAVIARLDDAAVGRAVAAMQNRFTDEGIGFVIACAGAARDAEACARTLVGLGAEGLVWFDAPSKERVGSLAGLSRIPVVAMRNADIGAGAVEGAQLAARYLAWLGHRQVAVIAHHTDIDDRVDASRWHRDEVEVVYWNLDGRGHRADAEGLIQSMLARSERPTALICDSDAIAVLALATCEQAGVNVPGAMSVVGFGDTENARLSAPPLTTVRVQSSLSGADAADCLLAAIASGQAVQSEIRVKLVIRGSTASAPA